MSRLVLILAALALTGCISNRQDGLYYRADGRKIPGNAALIQQFELDAAICKGEEARAGLAASSDVPAGAFHRGLDAVGQGCMARRGYVFRAK